MAKPNYAFEKRQRELAKKKKKEEKQHRKGVSDEPAPADPVGATQPATGTAAPLPPADPPAV